MTYQQPLSQVCELLRAYYPEGLPIIMISANCDEASILRGLEVSDVPRLSWVEIASNASRKSYEFRRFPH